MTRLMRTERRTPTRRYRDISQCEYSYIAAGMSLFAQLVKQECTGVLSMESLAAVN